MNPVIEVLEWIFQDWTHFIGTLMLLVAPFAVLADGIKNRNKEE